MSESVRQASKAGVEVRAAGRGYERETDGLEQDDPAQDAEVWVRG